MFRSNDHAYKRQLLPSILYTNIYNRRLRIATVIDTNVYIHDTIFSVFCGSLTDEQIRYS